MANNIAAGGIWSYFWANRQALLDNYHLVASNEEEGVEIYLTDEKGFPYFSVEVDGEAVYTVETVSSLDAENTYLELLNTYVYPNEDNLTEEDDDERRVKEITSAVEEMLTTLIEDDPYSAGMSPQEVDELASVIEEYLSDNCGISVHHPTEVDGAVVQYPYGEPFDEKREDGDDLPDIQS